MKNWSDFYDPDFYESKIGEGKRVAPEYASLLSKQKERVLELGCGPGEIVIALAQQGHSVIGLDSSERMLNRARSNVTLLDEELQQRIDFTCADFTSFTLASKVSSVILPNEAVAHLLSPEALMLTMENCYASLENSGQLLLDVPKHNFRNLADATGTGQDRLYCRGFYPTGADELSIRVIEQLYFDEADFIIKTIFSYETISAEGKLISTQFRELVQRLWTKQEIAFCLRACGFLEVSIFEMPSLEDRWFIKATK
jgi:SAM-dependent methyltransferase